jgi:hypothetical protein
VNTAVESEERAQLGNTAAKRIKEGRTRERPILFLLCAGITSHIKRMRVSVKKEEWLIVRKGA